MAAEFNRKHYGVPDSPYSHYRHAARKPPVMGPPHHYAVVPEVNPHRRHTHARTVYPLDSYDPQHARDDYLDGDFAMDFYTRPQPKMNQKNELLDNAGKKDKSK